MSLLVVGPVGDKASRSRAISSGILSLVVVVGSSSRGIFYYGGSSSRGDEIGICSRPVPSALVCKAGPCCESDGILELRFQPRELGECCRGTLVTDV